LAIAPEGAPVAGLTIGLILLAVACVFLLALNKVWEFTIGALLNSMANMVHDLPHVHILGHSVPPWDALAEGITKLDNYVLQGIGVGIQQTEKGLHALTGAMTWLLQETANQVAGLAEDTWKGFHSVRKYLIPAMLGAAVGPLIREISHLGARTKTIILHPTSIVHKTVQVITPGLKALEGKVNALEARVAAIGAEAPTIITAPPIAIPIPKPAAIPGEITRGIDSLWKRVRRIGKVLTPAGIVGLVGAATLSQFGLGWLRCKGVGRVGKGLCGASGLIETLFSDAIDALIVTDLCQVVSAMNYAAVKFEPVLLGFVDVEDALIGCHGATLPPALNVEALSLPPVTGFVLS
jgi:hypothetical protein